jgi:hypothetical protein
MAEHKISITLKTGFAFNWEVSSNDAVCLCRNIRDKRPMQVCNAGNGTIMFRPADVVFIDIKPPLGIDDAMRITEDQNGATHGQ